MTKELVYQGSLIRIEQVDNEAVTPVSDIAKAIGYKADKLSAMVKHDPVLAIYGSPVTGEAQTPSGGKYQQKLYCLKKEGVAGLLVKLNSSRIKDAGKREKVQKFQKWALTTLRAAMEDRLETPKAQMSPEMAEVIAGVLQDVARNMATTATAVNNVVDLTYSLSRRVEALENKKKQNHKKEEKRVKREAVPSMDQFFEHRPENLVHVCRDVREFISMSCIIDPDAATNLSYLYIVYENWAAANCQMPLGRNRFYDQIRLALAGFGDFVLNRTKLYVRGLRLRNVARVESE